MTPEERKAANRKLIEIANDFERYVKNNLKIKTKSGEIVLFELNNIQRRLVAMVLEDLEYERPIRYIVLKARQEGVSTLIEALIYWWTATHRQIKSKIVAHDTDTATELYEMFRRYYDNSNIAFKPTTKYNTRSDLTFDNDTDTGLKSQIDTASADNTGTGRGQTIHWLHGSEIAKWSKGAELLAGLMQAVPMLPNTAIFLESTANGVGDFFHRTWKAAKAGNSAFKPVFFSWADHEEYQRPVPLGFKITDEEKKLKSDFNLTDEQLTWRREKMKEFAGDAELFYQEYPLTDVEAFLASGRSRFDIPALIKMEEKAKDAQTYELVEKYDVIEPHKVTNAPLRIWQQPIDNRKYIIGADVAEGVNADFSVATVLDEEKLETVACWRGDCEPAEFGEVLEQLGRYYNQALIGCEINNHGLTTVQRLRDMMYDNLYRRERGTDERFEEYTSKLGWLTNRKTKPLMINALAEAIYAGKLIDPDKIFIQEAMSYIIDERGRTNAQEGAHDDTVISRAIALQLFEWSDVTEYKYRIKSKLPANYLEKRKKNRTLIKKRAIMHS